MSLTREHALARQSVLGASDSPALLECSPWQTPLGVWCTKARGKDGEVPPLTSWQPDPEAPSAFALVLKSDPTLAGSILEDGIVRLYEARTEAQCRRAAMRRHRAHPWMAASPDRLAMPSGVERYDRGVECKLVGSFSARAWDGDTLPEHVWVQCQQNMAVFEREMWDVAALLSGTNFVVLRVGRDDGFVRDALKVLGEWWRRHIIENQPPPPVDAEDLKRHVRRLHPLDNGQELNLVLPESRELAAIALPLLDEFLALDRAAKTSKEAAEAAKAKLEALCGEWRSLVTPAGRFNFPSQRGSVAWKRVAEHLAGGPVADEVAAPFRGEAYRKSQWYPRGGEK